MAQTILRDYLQETEDAISRGQHENALARCQCILASFPESLEAQRLLGEVYLAQGQLDEAQQAFDWVLTNDPENVIAYCDRALISERLTDYDTALDCYQQAYELSRGNSQIRHEFNKLSAKAGQQGFMFSRAGLARLYMRGDLLTQAVQEWEAVLAINPDRLDARTGLLETYWREGLYDQVEQLAKQILQDVPGCVKALLLLAYVISARDMLQARELLRKVEALDPDLTLAQDLLADAMASQPNDPFLQLLRKPPVTIDTTLESLPEALPPGSRERESAAQPALARVGARTNNLPNVQEVPDWSSLDTSWQNVVGARELETSFAVQDVPTLAWPNAPSPATGSGVWNAGEQGATSQAEQELPDFVAQLGERTSSAASWLLPSQEAIVQSGALSDATNQLEPWMSLQETLNNLHPSEPVNEVLPPQQSGSAATLDTFSWEQQPAFSESTFEDAWSSVQGAQEPQAAGDWASMLQDDLPSPPAWLSMLTQNDRKQMTGEIPAVVPSMQQASPSPAPAEQRPAAPEARQPEMGREERQLFAPEPGESEDDSLFGPEWLKSLGAASMDAASTVEPVSEEREAPAQPLPHASYEPWEETGSAAPVAEQPPEAVWEPEQAMSQAPQVQETFSPTAPDMSLWPGETDGQDMLTTLEALEQELRARGFSHLEPNTLAALVRGEGEASVVEAGSASQDQMQPPYVEPSLSSALAELGELSKQRQGPADYAYNTPAAQPEEASAASSEAFWAEALNAVPAPAAEEQESMQAEPVEQEQAEVPAVKPELAVEEHHEADSPSVFQAQSAAPSISESAEEKTVRVERVDPVKRPAARMSAFLENELETTMRRPAVRLQPMQQRPGRQRATPSSLASNRSKHREEPFAGNAAGGAESPSPRERLIRGYQHQLVGDYDEAMQEYRILIRTAPDQLGEVISNVRALLKLAPKYAPGYRVLGDAYMRQGEYLQAMEAYNKALTMAKRAKA